jgi:hypothetical protein
MDGVDGDGEPGGEDFGVEGGVHLGGELLVSGAIGLLRGGGDDACEDDGED